MSLDINEIYLEPDNLPILFLSLGMGFIGGITRFIRVSWCDSTGAN